MRDNPVHTIQLGTRTAPRGEDAREWNSLGPLTVGSIQKCSDVTSLNISQQLNSRPRRTVSLPEAIPQGSINTNTPLIQQLDEREPEHDPHAEDDITMSPLDGIGTPVGIISLAAIITLLSVVFHARTFTGRTLH